MASSRKTMIVAAGLGGLVTILLLGVWTRHHSINEQNEKNAILENTIASVSDCNIKGKLFWNRDLDQEESEYWDLSEYRVLIAALLSPCEQSGLNCADYPHICQLIIEKTDGSSLRVDITWVGTGKSLFCANGTASYVRSGECYPFSKDRFIDEATALCGLIESVIKGDSKERAS